jgi:hypothetical protein
MLPDLRATERQVWDTIGPPLGATATGYWDLWAGATVGVVLGP